MRILLIYTTLFFMIFELLKIIMLPTYWRMSLKRKEGKYRALTILEFLYMGFTVVLVITLKYWYVGILILFVSLITSTQIYEDVIEKTKFNKFIRKYLTIDSLVSILFLSIIVVKEILLK